MDFDTRFFQNKTQYLLQCLLPAVYMLLVLYCLGMVGSSIIIEAVGASSLAASAFIIFASPKSVAAVPKNFLISYLLAIIFGVFCEVLMWAIFHLSYNTSIPPHHVVALFGSIAVLLTMFLMVFMNVEHPPAAGLAVGLVIEPWDSISLLVISVACVVLYIMSRLLRSRLISLT